MRPAGRGGGILLVGPDEVGGSRPALLQGKEAGTEGEGGWKRWGGQEQGAQTAVGGRRREAPPTAVIALGGLEELLRGAPRPTRNVAIFRYRTGTRYRGYRVPVPYCHRPTGD